MRRSWPAAAAALFLAFAAVSCNNHSAPPVGGSGPAAPAVTLRILALNWPQAAVEQRLANTQFTPKTGIKVVLETNTYDNVEAKMKQVIQTRRQDYDIVDYDSQWLGEFVAGNGLERLDTPQYLNSPRSTLNFDRDFLPQWSVDLCKYPTRERDVFEGHFAPYKNTPVYGLPWSTGCQILFYRADLLKAAGISRPPNTWAEFAADAQKLTQPGKRYGAWTHAARQEDYITQDFFPIMWSYGGDLWDPIHWKTEGIMNSPENVKALQFYVDWNLKEHIVPPASANWSNEEVFNAVSQDQVAMGQFWATFGAGLEDPKTSKIVGKMAYAVVPGVAGPDGVVHRAAMYGSQGAAITAFSQHKAQAWQYLEWLLSKPTQEALLKDPTSAFVSARTDLVAETKSTNPRNKAVLDSTPFVHDFWNNPEYSRLLDTVQRELNAAFVGQKTPRAALDDAARETQAILDASPYRPKS